MLELKKISVGYGKELVLEDATTTFKKGRLTSIIGVNGCGKSTLIRAALGILPLKMGEATVDGQDIATMKRNDIARKLAYLSQGKNTPDMTVEQMVLHGRFPYLNYPRCYTSHDRELAERAMDAVGISALAEKPLEELSGGMRQNAYIAMALAQDTEYILLDEPTTYLDISHQLDLMKLLRALADSGKGIIVVMHDLPLAFDFSDEIVVIDDKTVKMQAPPQEICKSGYIESIFGVSINLLEDSKTYTYRYR